MREISFCPPPKKMKFAVPAQDFCIQKATKDRLYLLFHEQRRIYVFKKCGKRFLKETISDTEGPFPVGEVEIPPFFYLETEVSGFKIYIEIYTQPEIKPE